MRIFKFLSLVVLLILFMACNEDEVSIQSSYGIFSNQDSQTVIMNGVIGSTTPRNWDSYIGAYPETKLMLMRDCPGSMDDEANLETARKMRQHGISIHLPTDAVIASGAVDMFLAGVNRSRDSGSRIGVHSWSDGSVEATSFPVGHEFHQPYINYYVEMGMTREDAEAFYYFTINAAPAAEVHWMTDSEIQQYKLLKD